MAILDGYDLSAVAYGGLINEDVMQQIWDVSKIPLPFTDAVGELTSKNPYKEWTTDALASPDLTNAVIDGTTVTTEDDTAVGERVGNHHQISWKVVNVSTRARETDNVGRADELAYQVIRRQQELRRDVEAIALSNQASVRDTGAGGSAGKSGGLGAWLETSAYRGTNGADGGFNSSTGVVATITAGSHRALTEKLLRDCVQSIYSQGGNPTKLMSIPSVVRVISEYLFTSSARIATLMADQGKSGEKATALGSVKVFVTDFGTLELTDNRLQQTYKAYDTTTDVANVFILDPEYLALSYLHGYRTEPLAKQGLSDRRMMAVDWTLVVKSEVAQGVIADVDPSQAMTAS